MEDPQTEEEQENAIRNGHTGNASLCGESQEEQQRMMDYEGK